MVAISSLSVTSGLRAKRDQGGHHGHVGNRIDRKAGSRSETDDQHARESRAYDPGGVHDHVIEAHGAGQIARWHQLSYKGLAGRRIDNLDASPQDIDGYHDRDARMAQRSERPQQAS